MKKGIRALLIVCLAAYLGGGCALVEDSATGWFSTTDDIERPYALDMKTIMVDDVNIAYMEAGEDNGGPVVVMVHGGIVPLRLTHSLYMADSQYTTFSFLTALGFITPLAQSTMHAGAVTVSDTWNYNIKELAESHHVIALDLPGFGGSDKPDIDYTTDDFVMYLEQFIEAKGLDKVSLVGHGMGGMISIVYCLENPEKVDRMALIESFGAFGPSDGFMQNRSVLNLPRLLMKYVQKEKAAKVNIFYPLYSRMLGGWEGPKRQVVYLTLSPQMQHDNQNQSGRLILFREGTSGEFLETVTDFKVDFVTSEDFRDEVHATHKALLDSRTKRYAERLPEITVPVLIVHGNYDPVVDEAEAMYMEAAIPHAQMVVYEKSAHYPMVEQSGEFNADLMFFLSADSASVKEKAYDEED